MVLQWYSMLQCSCHIIAIYWKIARFLANSFQEYLIATTFGNLRHVRRHCLLMYASLPQFTAAWCSIHCPRWIFASITVSSSQQSIQEVVAFALKYFTGCGEDLWECIIEECQKVSVILSIISSSFHDASFPPSLTIGVLVLHHSMHWLWDNIWHSTQGSINHRINILYFLDSLCETSLLAKAHQPQEQSSFSSSSWVLSHLVTQP